MITELFTLLSNVDVNGKGKSLGQRFSFNVNRNRIRSISAYSSNSIFYFKAVASDQITPEEMTMCTRFLEKSYASFVAACISLMPFHRVKADDQASVESYLSQFHQNMGISDGGHAAAAKIFDTAWAAMGESVSSADIEETQNFLLECWEKSRAADTDFVKVVSETVSLNDMFSKDPIDPVTRVMQESFNRKMAELDTWGFLGEATVDTLDNIFAANNDLIAAAGLGLDDEDDLDLDDLDDEDLDMLEDEFPELADLDVNEATTARMIKGSSAVWQKEYESAKALGHTNDQAAEIASRKVAELKDRIAKLKNNAKELLTRGRKRAEDMVKTKDVTGGVNESAVLNEAQSWDERYAKCRKRYDDMATGMVANKKIVPFFKDVAVVNAFPKLIKTATSDDQLNKIEEMILGRLEMGRDVEDSGVSLAYLNDVRKRRGLLKTTGKGNGVNLLPEEKYQNMVAAVREAEKLALQRADIDTKRMMNYGIWANAMKNESTVNEGNVRTAIDSVIFAIDGVSENRINSCTSLVKLGQLESKLMKLKARYAKYLTRYKKNYAENEKNGTEKKLHIKFNGYDINDPRSFMKQYGEYIKIINKRLAMIDARREELRSRKVKYTPKDESAMEATLETITKNDFDTLDHLIESINAQISAPDDVVFYLESPVDEATVPTNGYDIAVEMLKAAPGVIRDARGDNARTDHYEEDHPFQKDTRASSEYKSGVLYNRKEHSSNINVAAAASRQNNFQGMHTFDKSVFTDMDMKKANEAIPTFTKATIGFIVDETEQVVTRDILVGIKVWLEKVPAKSLIDEFYNALINKRKFLRFVKWISGEEKSLADLLFGFKELKIDAASSRKPGVGQWMSAFRQRKRWTKMSVPYLTKNFTPNGTVICTMNEVRFIKSEYGLDMMKPEHIKMLMDQNFLLGFVILDQSSETAYITYDGHNGHPEIYTYSALEREQQSNDRMMRELYRTISR